MPGSGPPEESIRHEAVYRTQPFVSKSSKMEGVLCVGRGARSDTVAGGIVAE